MINGPPRTWINSTVHKKRYSDNESEMQIGYREIYAKGER
jgi:hypothetical protein